MLDSYNSSNPIWFGAKYTFNDAPKIYMSGGSGYVLSKAALEMYVKVKLFPTDLYLPGASFFVVTERYSDNLVYQFLVEII